LGWPPPPPPLPTHSHSWNQPCIQTVHTQRSTRYLSSLCDVAWWTTRPSNTHHGQARTKVTIPSPDQHPQSWRGCGKDGWSQQAVESKLTPNVRRWGRWVQVRVPAGVAAMVVCSRQPCVRSSGRVDVCVVGYKQYPPLVAVCSKLTHLLSPPLSTCAGRWMRMSSRRGVPSKRPAPPHLPTRILTVHRMQRVRVGGKWRFKWAERCSLSLPSPPPTGRRCAG
jgi:hypothetical protein